MLTVAQAQQNLANAIASGNPSAIAQAQQQLAIAQAQAAGEGRMTPTFGQTQQGVGDPYANFLNGNSSLPPNNGYAGDCGCSVPKPIVNYKQFTGCTVPSSITLFATAGAGITKLYFADATDLFTSYGFNGAGTQAMDVQGQGTPANLKAWLQTKWLYVCGFNFNSSNTATLQNTLLERNFNIDGTNTQTIISNGSTVTNQQFNANLLNINCGFLWTNVDSLELPVTAGDVVSLTFKFGACGYYHQLGAFKATYPNLCNASGC